MNDKTLKLGGIIASTSIALSIAQPSWAQVSTQVTGVSVQPSGQGMELILQTSDGNRPQIFVIQRGDALVADLVNTQLSLPNGGAFRQENPSPGIASVIVTPLDSNSTRVVINGTGSAPAAEVLQQDTRGIVFSYNTGDSSPAAQNTAETPVPTPPPPAATQTAQLPNINSNAQGSGPEVLVPNPRITIQGAPTSAINPAPSMLPRAVPPPIGDIAISNLDPSAAVINLATNQRVPRLVLKDAPVQDVLALLARAAGLNVAFYEAPPTEGAANAAAPQLKISLDIEDESVQDVFNNVLRLTGLQASRQGTTIVVGANLPDSARNAISRTLRLNQMGLVAARDFLISQGAESNEVQTREQIQTTAIPGSDVPIVTRNVQTQVELITADAEDEPYQGRAPLPLRGLLVSIGRRSDGAVEVGNEITLVGEPRQVELATAMLSQLETRRPQVAVNVKIVDVNLLNDERFRSSFSFGIGDTFVVSDGGSGVINFGGAQPPNEATFNSSPITAPVIPNPYQGDPFFDISNPISVPGTSPGTTFVGSNGSISGTPNGSGQVPSAISGVSEDPFQGGITGVTPATSNVVTQAADGTITTTLGQAGSVEFSLPSLFQYPTRFLSTLRAQVVSGNAKILTDPTLVVQEGETAVVNLTNDVVKSVTVDFTDTNAGQRETRTVEFEQVGLLLSLQVQRIDDNGFVTLRADPTVSSPSGQIDIGDDQFVTTVQRRTVSSGRIRVRDGQTLILSGIIQDSDRTSVTKWPILGDLPIIGALFRNTSTTNQRNEVIVLLTPNIIQDADAATFGYGYTPGPEAREVLQQGNFSDPTRPR